MEIKCSLFFCLHYTWAQTCRYDLLYGVTELESYHSMNAVSLTYGILANERDYTLKLYMQDRFGMGRDLALAATLKE